MTKLTFGLLVATLALPALACGPHRAVDVAGVPAANADAGAPEVPAAGEETAGAPSPSPPMPPPMPLTIPVFSGVRDYSPAFLGDGPTVLWLHQEDCAIYLRTAAPPYSAVDGNHRIAADDACEINGLGATLATADGKHVFAVLGDRIHHLVLEAGEVRREEPVPESGFSSNLAGSADGGRLFTEIDGPSTAEQSPGWRAVALFDGGEGWKRTVLTEAEPPHLAELVGASGDGRAVLYDVGSTDRWGTPERIVFAVEAGSGAGSDAGGGVEWRGEEPDFGDLALHPRALAADGSAMLLQGFPRELGGERSGFNLYLARTQGGAWGRPVMVVRDEPRGSVYVPGMSHDAKQVLWEHYTRDADDAIVRSEVRMIAAGERGWTEPAVLFSRDEYFQIDRLVANGRGQAAFDAWSRTDEDADRFILHAYVVPDVGQANAVVRLSDLVVAP